jgi:hypothetical protein
MQGEDVTYGESKSLDENRYSYRQTEMLKSNQTPETRLHPSEMPIGGVQKETISYGWK